MVLHQVFCARRVQTHGIGGEVRHGVTSGVSCESSKTWNVTPHLHREAVVEWEGAMRNVGAPKRGAAAKAQVETDSQQSVRDTIMTIAITN